MNNLKKKTINGLKWNIIEQASIHGLRFVLGVILARLLLPSDYGVTGLIVVFLAVSQVFINSGFGAALIQKKNRTNIDFSTVFYFNIVVSVVCWLLLTASRNWFAEFFNEPLLAKITPVIGLNLVLNALALIQRTRLTIDLNFKAQAKASLIATVVAGLIGITLAYNGYGVWALVYQTLARNIATTILLWLYEKWLPELVFSVKSFKSLFSFGSKLMISGLLNTIYKNIYVLMIGKFFSATDLGFYNRANQFKNLPSTNITSILSRVTFPALSILQDNDKKLLSTFRKFMKMTMFVTMPLMAGMLVLAKPIILVTLADQWSPSIPLLQLLCIVGIFYPIHALNLTILQVKGRSDLFLRLEIIKKIFTTASILLTFSISVKAMVIGSIITSFIGLYINTHYTKKILDYGFFQQMRDFMPTTLLTLLMVTTIFISTFCVDNNLLKLILGMIVGIITYLGVAILYKFEEINEIKSIMKRT